MKPYDAQREHLTWYFRHYSHVIVIRDLLPHDWMEANLTPTYVSAKEDCMGQAYTQKIIGFGISGVHHRDDESFMFLYDREHVRQIVEAFPELIVTTDPFGPDLCSCGSSQHKYQGKTWPEVIATPRPKPSSWLRRQLDKMPGWKFRIDNIHGDRS